MATQLTDVYKKINPEGSVLDVGCFGFRQYNLSKTMGLNSLQHFGVDYCDCKDGVPENFIFRKADLSKEPIPFDDDQFDLIVASHIIEHLSNPIDFFGECARVCKPGGLMYFEAPSERALLLPGMPYEREKFFSLSFYDDPTHQTRPWTPQSFYRLSKYFSCEPIEVGYRTSWGHRVLFPLRLIQAIVTKNGKLLESCCWGAFGWASYLIVQKPTHIKGKPEFYYYIPENR